MTLIEALKTGKRFKRETSMGDWHINDKELIYKFRTSDLLADDWIVEEPKLTVAVIHRYRELIEKSMRSPDLSKEEKAELESSIDLMKGVYLVGFLLDRLDEAEQQLNLFVPLERFKK